ncbi:MAG: hypothetical protein MUE51_10615 [Thermoleophilia bacterium]|nr:hypothetical protein [Thermoleophilia bacterium]
MTRPLRALAPALIIAAAAGCGGGSAPAPPSPPPPPPAWFQGRAGGVGASVDLAGVDAPTRAVRAALAGRPGTVAVASLVNLTDRRRRVPRLVAVLGDGRRAPFVSARAALDGVPGPAAARARAALPPDRPLAAREARAVPVVLAGHPARAVVGVRMIAAGRPPADLDPVRPSG